MRTKKNDVKPWIKYANDVVNGKVVTGDYIKLACRNYLEYIDSEKYEMRDEVVERAIDFISIFRHFKGKSANKPFILEPWQQWVVSAIVGVYYRGTNKRKHNTVYLEISRKNGKSALCAALSLYFLIADGEAGAECGCVANSKEQAKILYEFCEVWSKQLDPKQKELKAYRDRINFKANNSKLIVCSSADDKLDGHGFTAAICDEFHAAKSNKLRDVIKSSMTRENAVLITITTAGFDKTGPCYKLRTTCVEILEKLKEDDSVFAAIYSLDEGDDWTDKKVWCKATPNLNLTVDEEYIERQVKSAINNTSEEVGVRTKTLNQWLSSTTVWISDNFINKCTKKLYKKNFSDCECFVGVDLAAVSDMTAVTYLFFKEDEDKYYFITDYYLPETCLRTSPNRELYQYWQRTKQLTITSGNVTDYDYITNDMVKVQNKCIMKSVGYDDWNATQWAISATDLGLPLRPYSQSIGNFNRPTREMERLILQNKAVIDNNEITRWMFRNVALKTDHNGNVKPNKGIGNEKKIDGVISMIESLGIYLDTPRFTGSIDII